MPINNIFKVYIMFNYIIYNIYCNYMFISHFTYNVYNMYTNKRASINIKINITNKY